MFVWQIHVGLFFKYLCEIKHILRVGTLISKILKKTVNMKKKQYDGEKLFGQLKQIG